MQGEGCLAREPWFREILEIKVIGVGTLKLTFDYILHAGVAIQSINLRLPVFLSGIVLNKLDLMIFVEFHNVKNTKVICVHCEKIGKWRKIHKKK